MLQIITQQWININANEIQMTKLSKCHPKLGLILIIHGISDHKTCTSNYFDYVAMYLKIEVSYLKLIDQQQCTGHDIFVRFFLFHLTSAASSNLYGSTTGY